MEFPTSVSVDAAFLEKTLDWARQLEVELRSSPDQHLRLVSGMLRNEIEHKLASSHGGQQS